MPLPQIHHPESTVQLLSKPGVDVTIRPMTLRHEKTIMMAKESGEDTDILRSIIQIVSECTSIPTPTVLPLYDVEWLYLKIRSISVSETVKLTFTEELEDGEEKIHRFEIDLKDVKGKTVDKNISNVIKIGDVALELAHPACQLYLVGDYAKANYQEKFDLLLRNSVKSITQGDESFPRETMDPKELDEWLGNLPLDALTKAQEFLGNTPSLYHEIKYEDAKGEEQVIVLSTLNDFFLF